MKNPAPAIEIKPIEVHVTSSFEDACRRFKSAVQKEGVLSEFKDRMKYEKPSVKKRKKARQSVERRMLEELREKLIQSGEWDKRKKRKDKRKAEKLERKIKRQENLEI